MKTFILLVSLTVLVVAVSVGYPQTPVKPTPTKPTPTAPGQKTGTVTTPATPSQRPATPTQRPGAPQPVAGSAQLPPGTALLELRGTRGQGVNVLADERLMTGTQGTIDFWVATQWDSAKVAQDQPLMVVKLGSTSKNAWGIFISPGKDTIGLWNGEGQEEWPFNFADGALHHVALATNERGTELFIDGRTKGVRPVSYGNPGEGVVLPMTIGPAPFVGRIGGVRIWKTRLSAEVLRRLKDTPSSGMEGQAEASNLVGYLGGTGAAARFNMLTASFSIGGIWRKDDAEVGVALGQSGTAKDFIYKPAQLVTIRLLPENHALVRLGGASPTPSATAVAGKPAATGGNKVPVLLLDDPASGKLVVRTLQTSGRNQYSAGTLALKLIDNGRLQIGQTLYRRAEKQAKNTQKMNEGFKGAIPSNLEFSERGYHLPRINPWDYRDTGTQRKLFMHFKPDSLDYDLEPPLMIPRGLKYRATSGSWTTTEAKSYSNTSDYYNAMTFGIGVSANAEVGIKSQGSCVGVCVGGGFSLNTEFKNALTKMQSERRLHRFQVAECRKYDLVLDKANATLSDQFRQAVESLKRSGSYSQFVESWGTHYPHGVVYGAKGVKDISITEKSVSESKQSTQEIQASIKAAVDGTFARGGGELSGKYGRDTKNGSGNSTELEITKSFSVGATGGVDGLSCANLDEVTPIRLDLRPLDELLTPPFFDDPEILTRVREGLKQAIAKTLADANANLAQFLSTQTTFAPRPKQAGGTAATQSQQPQTCPAKTYRLEKSYDVTHAYVDLSLPARDEGETYSWEAGGYWKGHEAHCDYIGWSKVVFNCRKGKWELAPVNIEGGGSCSGATNYQQTGMTAGLNRTRPR